MAICKEVDDYIKYVRKNPKRNCKEQFLLIDHIEKCFKEEDLRIDKKQLKRYMGLQKHFPYELFSWEKFLFTLHNCVYTKEGFLRWPNILCLVGRGSGKNGYLAFEDFALITPINGVMDYDIDTFATSEDQARTTFDDIYNVLADDETYFKDYFSWNRVEITNLKTRSAIRYRTSNASTKDGGRPGKVNFDEYHAYTDYKLIEVATTGLGKKKHPRRTIISTQGDVRDGPLDRIIELCEDILNGRADDNGFLPFICWLDEKEEVHNEEAWYKANPSLQYFPNLLREMRGEYVEFKRDPANHSSFMTKRMNRPPKETTYNVTKWENLVTATRELPKLNGKSCICGIDFAKINDFAAAGLLFKDGEERNWLHHTWICKQSRDLAGIKYPYEQDLKAGTATLIDGPEIPPEVIIDWIAKMQREYSIEAVALDSFRYALFREGLKKIGFEGKEKVKLVRPSDIMRAAPVIGHVFATKNLAWGTSKIMRWYTWNVKAVVDGNGNTNYEKIAPDRRKTDGFMAMVSAFTLEEKIKKKRVARKNRKRVII